MGQEAWSDEDERHYEHVKQSEMQRGRSGDEAEETAARTVNEQRRKEDRTERETISGTGDPKERLAQRTMEELRNRAAELGIDGRRDMGEDELVPAIRKRNSAIRKRN